MCAAMPVARLRAASRPQGSVGQTEGDLEQNLKSLDLLIDYVATGFHDLKPLQIVERFAGLLDSALDRVIDTDFGRADHFDDFCYMMRHFTLLWI